MKFDVEMIESILNRVHTVDNGWAVKLTKRNKVIGAMDREVVLEGFYVITLQHDDGDLNIYEVPDTKKYLEEVSDEYDRLLDINDGYKYAEGEAERYAVENVLSHYETINEILWG